MVNAGKDDRQNEPDPSDSGAFGPSALDLLEQDHREVEGYFEQYEEEGADKDAIVLKICLALEVHTRIEEEIFYPAAREAIEQRDLIDEALVEHGSAKQLIADIEAMEAGDELHAAKVKVLAEQIRHHIEEEQNRLFPQLREADLDLDTLGAKLAQRKAELFQELADGGEVT
jgi:Hemerythrin HHE cation binding domain